MTTFPLYDQLVKQIKKPDEDEGICDFFIDNFSRLHEIEHEIVYALIKMYQIDNEDDGLHDLPYEGKRLKKSVKFNFDKFPAKLQYLLYTFMTLHLNKMS